MVSRVYVLTAQVVPSGQVARPTWTMRRLQGHARFGEGESHRLGGVGDGSVHSGVHSGEGRDHVVRHG